MQRDNKYKWMRGAGLASSIALVLVVAIFIGYALGLWLDSIFGTEPWLMLLFTLLGIVAGFIEMIRIAIRLSKEE